MDFQHINQFDEDNKWKLALKGLIHLIDKNHTFEEDEKILNIFENIDMEFREQKAIPLYDQMWKIAYRRGKIQLSKEYVNFYINYLLEYKRIPRLILLKEELKKAGFKKIYKKISTLEELIGKVENKDEYSELPSEYYSNLHPELFRHSRDKLKKYLIEVEEWDIEDWKLCYEFIIRYYFDSDIFLRLKKQAKSLNKSEHTKALLMLLKEKKIKIPSDILTPSSKLDSMPGSGTTSYDQIALDLISGAAKPDIYEQRRIMVFINQMSDEEIIGRGKDMSIAFNFLGMDLVVNHLCKRLTPLVVNLKEKISLYFILAESLLCSGEYYEVIDLCNDLTSGTPLNDDELLAFEYILAESYFFLGKSEKAQLLYKRLLKKNPNYRMIAMRIRILESSK